MPHIPVLLNEVLEVLNPKRGEFFIDGTVDGGGHAASILEKMMPEGKFLGLDWDKEILEKTRKKIEAKFQIPNSKFQIFWINDNFKNIPMILKNKKLGKADDLLLDLGFSSEQLESADWRTGRGFSFNPPAGGDEPLLMTYSDSERPVREWLKLLKEFELTRIIREFGEERYAQRIARAIKTYLPIQTSKKLAEIISRAVPKNYERGRIHPATRTFQALRIFANQELGNLRNILLRITDVLNPGGRLAVITFHSIEDRIIKNVFRNLAKEGKVEILTKKPIQPSQQEVQTNPRSRSAKLRALKIL
jgi:16S rRNA (cytosine1402-N4)-methyltransferase